MTPKQALLHIMFLGFSATSLFAQASLIQAIQITEVVPSLVLNEDETVALVDFTVALDGPEALLRWSTAHESQNKGFQLQRSLDGLNWEVIGFVSGSNAQETTRYQYWDEIPAKGNILYRLQQISMQGNIFDYPIRELSRQAAVAIVNP